MKSISKSEKPGLAALAKEAPEVVRSMVKGSYKITKKNGGKIAGFKNGGVAMIKTNQNPHMS
tara:strand:- start:1442 stop:1627 length:186 start_codon:yes stop_codon:yes gene_type:complete